MDRIPVLDPSAEIEALWDELNVAIQDVLRSGQFIMGPAVKAFETEVGDYLGIKHAIGLNSGTDALVIGLRALGVSFGDEVVTTPFTFFATAEAISLVGATPVFVDINPKTYNLDPALIEEKITSRTRALIPVHLFGQAADMNPILTLADKYGLRVLEDTAQAFSGEYKDKKLGTIGDAGVFSFFPSKNLGAYGDGGMIVTHDDGVAETARMLRMHGAKKKHFNETVGYNSRLDAIQAAILRVKLPHIDTWSEERRQVARTYNELLQGLPQVVPPHEALWAKHVYHQYTVRILGGRRDAVRKRLAEAGIDTAVYYPVPVHRLPVYARLNRNLPLAEEAASEVLSLPIWPRMPRVVQERVVETLRRALLKRATC
jgi:dTDP-4-amino-4,6-dideoxygalactose transaminase